MPAHGRDTKAKERSGPKCWRGYQHIHGFFRSVGRAPPPPLCTLSLKTHPTRAWGCRRQAKQRRDVGCRLRVRFAGTPSNRAAGGCIMGYGGYGEENGERGRVGAWRAGGSSMNFTNGFFLFPFCFVSRSECRGDHSRARAFLLWPPGPWWL